MHRDRFDAHVWVLAGSPPERIGPLSASLLLNELSLLGMEGAIPPERQTDVSPEYAVRFNVQLTFMAQIGFGPLGLVPGEGNPSTTEPNGSQSATSTLGMYAANFGQFSFPDGTRMQPEIDWAAIDNDVNLNVYGHIAYAANQFYPPTDVPGYSREYHPLSYLDNGIDIHLVTTQTFLPSSTPDLVNIRPMLPYSTTSSNWSAPLESGRKQHLKLVRLTVNTCSLQRG